MQIVEQVYQSHQWASCTVNKMQASDQKSSQIIALLMQMFLTLAHPVVERLSYDPNRDRYPNILPSLWSIVKVAGTVLVNASYVFKDYIATQSPLPTTMEHFWLMVWEQNANIVNLTDYNDVRKNKTMKYYPDLNCISKLACGIVVTCISMKKEHGCTVYSFTLTKDNEERTITMWHYQWPDQGVPSTTTDIKDLARKINECKQLTIVHCSAGVGRTGTFIAIAELMHQVNNGKPFNKESLQQIVVTMRKARSYMVQTKHQFVYIHDVIMEYINDITPKQSPHQFISTSPPAIAPPRRGGPPPSQPLAGPPLPFFTGELPQGCRSPMTPPPMTPPSTGIPEIKVHSSFSLKDL